MYRALILIQPSGELWDELEYLLYSRPSHPTPCMISLTLLHSYAPKFNGKPSHRVELITTEKGE